MSRVPNPLVDFQRALTERFVAEQEAADLEARREIALAQLAGEQDARASRPAAEPRGQARGGGQQRQPIDVGRVRGLVSAGQADPFVSINGEEFDTGTDLTPPVDPSLITYAQLLNIDPKLAELQSRSDIAQQRNISAQDRANIQNKQRQFNTMYNRFDRFAQQTNMPIEERQRITEEMISDFEKQTQPSPFSYYDYLDENNDPTKKALKGRDIMNGYLNTGDTSRLHELIDVDPQTGAISLEDVKRLKEIVHGSDAVEKERMKAVQNLVGNAAQVAANPTEENIAAYRALTALHQQRFGSFAGPVPQYEDRGEFDIGQELQRIVGGPKQTAAAPSVPAFQSQGVVNRFVVKSNDAADATRQIVEDAKAQARATGKSVPVHNESGAIIGYANP